MMVCGTDHLYNSTDITSSSVTGMCILRCWGAHEEPVWLGPVAEPQSSKLRPTQRPIRRKPPRFHQSLFLLYIQTSRACLIKVITAVISNNNSKGIIIRGTRVIASSLRDHNMRVLNRGMGSMIISSRMVDLRISSTAVEMCMVDPR